MKKVSTLVVITLLLLIGCSSIGKDGTVVDNKTKKQLEVVPQEKGTFIYQPTFEDMESDPRVGYDFYTRQVVIDQHYYETNGFLRGDIILHSFPEINKEKYPHIQLGPDSLSRIIALPGERIRIEDGKVFINGKRLDTFYSEFNRLGQNFTEYIEGKSEKEKKEYRKLYSTKEITVPEGAVFVIDDDWFRGFDSQHFGPLKNELIKGKVLGYLE